MLNTTSNSPILVIDANNLAWKNFHAMRKTFLSAGDVQTGMLYGVFRDIITLCDEFQTSDMVWCFDMESTRRKAIQPDYKGNRKPQTPAEEVIRKEANRQIEYLRVVLNSLGFRNVLAYPGFEADDLVAMTLRTCRRMGLSDRIKFIISRDADLYQLLRTNIIAYDMTKKSYLTAAGFRKKYGLSPKRWAMVKAIAGCDGDNVKGIKGAGELTATRYLLGTLPSTKTGDKVRAAIEADPFRIAQNYDLVKLPFPDCPAVEFQDDKLSSKKWAKVMKSLKMASLIRRYPF